MGVADRKLILIVCLLVISQAHAAVTLSDFFTSDMVLQRDQPVRVWGWADPSEKITVTIDGIAETALANESGDWQVLLPAHQAGGPFSLLISTPMEKVLLENVMYGDVWFCSGQSNMGWKVVNATGADAELRKPAQPMIRLLTMKRTMSSEPQNHASTSKWEIANAQSISDFSGVAYFFGQYLRENLNVPIGLIHSSWGGTNVQTWMGSEAIKDFPGYTDQVRVLDTLDVSRTEKAGKRKYYQWMDDMEAEDAGLKEEWFEPLVNKSDWKTIRLPIYWKQVPINPTTGIAWVSKVITLTPEDLDKNLILSLGRVDDEDITYVNGKQVGSGTNKDLERIYEVSPNVFVAGENEITVRVKNKKTTGGFRSSAEKLFLQTNARKIALAGDWKFRPGTPETFPEAPYQLHPNDYPTLLFNGMVNPATRMTITGVIWYQGESNAKEAEEYAKLFPAMISQWRDAWNSPKLPFLFVQLANYDMPGSLDVPYFAELREAQTSALKLENVGMAVAVDIGESDNIHPANKREVGRRLGLAAQKLAYGEDVEFSGPVFQAVKEKKNSLFIAFDYAKGLKTTNGSTLVEGFEIAVSGGEFTKVTGTIIGDQVRLEATGIKEPYVLRYAWANDPGPLNLANEAGLPAVPFRCSCE